MTTHMTKTWFEDGKLITQVIPESETYKRDWTELTDADIHSCHYGCARPACISRQRDELRDYAMAIYQEVMELDPTHRMTMKQVMEYATKRLKELA